MKMSSVILMLSLVTIFFTISTATTTSVVDFCVADFRYPVGPAGYPCKNPDSLTANDFVFSGFRVPGNTSNIFKFHGTTAFVADFPALNGLGLSMIRLDIGVGGVVPIHTHRVSEVILVIDGPILAGFIDGDNNAYVKTLYKGDVMIFPQNLLHFQVNLAKKPALAFVSLNSANPGFQTTTFSLFSNDIPTYVIKKITLLDPSQVKKLKELLGGTN